VGCQGEITTYGADISGLPQDIGGNLPGLTNDKTVGERDGNLLAGDAQPTGNYALRSLK
jgi:hypothetical protein